MDLAILFMAMMYCPCVEDMVHVANVLYLSSYLVRDILWLRILTIFAGLSLLPFYCNCSDHVLWAPIIWNLLFMAVNSVQIAILLRERRPKPLGGSEQELYDKVFADLAPGEFRRLLRHGDWKDVEAGTLLVQKDTVVSDMMVLKQGAMDVFVEDRVIARLTPGQFIGEMSFLTGDKATADVRASQPSRVLVWSQERLNELLDNKATLAFKIRGILGRDVVGKLRTQSDFDEKSMWARYQDRQQSPDANRDS
jgi:CRP-like cAMP-binding protein